MMDYIIQLHPSIHINPFFRRVSSSPRENPATFQFYFFEQKNFSPLTAITAEHALCFIVYGPTSATAFSKLNRNKNRWQMREYTFNNQSNNPLRKKGNEYYFDYEW